MDEAFAEQPMVVSLTRARTYRVDDARSSHEGAVHQDAVHEDAAHTSAAHDGAEHEGAAHADELRSRPTPYERLMADMKYLRDEAMRLGVDPYAVEGDALDVSFPGGTLHVSGAALALSAAPVHKPAQDEAPQEEAGQDNTAEATTPATDEELDDAFADTEMQTDSSLSGGVIAPNLGERVL